MPKSNDNLHRINTDLKKNKTGQNRPGCALHTAAIEPLECDKHHRLGLKRHGIDEADTSALFAFFNKRDEIMHILAAKSPTLFQLIQGLKNIRNTLVGHLIGGAVPTPKHRALEKTLLDLLAECRTHGIITEADHESWRKQAAELSSFTFLDFMGLV